MRAEGVINCLKAPGLTSHGVVRRVRALVGSRSVGHAGTLDPEGAGVLLVCLGRATRLSEYLMAVPKEYLAEITFGTETDTDDAWGSVIREGRTDISGGELKRILPDFVGSLSQTPPRISALKHRGKPLYRWAREGRPVDPSPRTVKIHRLEVVRWDPPRALILVRCSQGTYVRSLCRDLGRALGSAAHMSFLLRTRVGPYQVSGAWTLEELGEGWKQQPTPALIPMGHALPWTPFLRVTDPVLIRRIGHGQPPPLTGEVGNLRPGYLLRLLDGRDNLLALARVREEPQALKLEKVFPGGEIE